MADLPAPQKCTFCPAFVRWVPRYSDGKRIPFDTDPARLGAWVFIEDKLMDRMRYAVPYEKLQHGVMRRYNCHFDRCLPSQNAHRHEVVKADPTAGLKFPRRASARGVNGGRP